MTAHTDRAWEIATWPIAAAWWHGLNALGVARDAFDRALCRLSNELTADVEEEQWPR